MKKVLVLTPILPYPPDDGSRIRTYQTIKSLYKKYKIDICSFYTEEDDVAGAKEFLMTLCDNVFLFPLPKVNKLLQKLFVYAGDKLTKKEISKIIEKERYDFLHVEKLMMFYYVGNKKIPTVLDSWGIDSSIAYQKFLFEKNFVKKIFELLKYLRHLICEMYILKKANFLIAITQQQVEFYKKYLKDKSIFLIPNWIDTNYFVPSEQYEKNTLIFTGIMNFYPNIDAVKFFCKEILPTIKKIRPEVKFYIVGKNPTKEIVEINNSKDIIVTGKVSDVKEYLNKAEIFVSPLRMGSGLRNKILEAMSCGKPIVATSHSCEGLNVKNGEHLLIADTPEEFVDKVLLLLNNKNLNNYLSNNARMFVIENFSISKIESLWLECYEQIFNSYNNL
ncbi:MAG: glycosyltransferase family 4 protein [Elusimicrobiota bacterium]|nr:glycosyltransferase family 4 protein [Elusimicrobiota bacterium]